MIYVGTSRSYSLYLLNIFIFNVTLLLALMLNGDYFVLRFYICLLLFIIVSIISTSDLQPSTAIVNQLPGQLVSIQIRIIGQNCFKFIVTLTMTSTNIV